MLLAGQTHIHQSGAEQIYPTPGTLFSSHVVIFKIAKGQEAGKNINK